MTNHQLPVPPVLLAVLVLAALAAVALAFGPGLAEARPPGIHP
jgi:hypothetical protein